MAGFESWSYYFPAVLLEATSLGLIYAAARIMVMSPRPAVQVELHPGGSGAIGFHLWFSYVRTDNTFSCFVCVCVYAWNNKSTYRYLPKINETCLQKYLYRIVHSWFFILNRTLDWADQNSKQHMNGWLNCGISACGLHVASGINVENISFLEVKFN